MHGKSVQAARKAERHGWFLWRTGSTHLVYALSGKMGWHFIRIYVLCGTVETIS